MVYLSNSTVNAGVDCPRLQTTADGRQLPPKKVRDRRMRIDEKEFFREATLRICGSLELEKALHHCLLYIVDFIPAGQMG